MLWQSVQRIISHLFNMLQTGSEVAETYQITLLFY